MSVSEELHRELYAQWGAVYSTYEQIILEQTVQKKQEPFINYRDRMRPVIEKLVKKAFEAGVRHGQKNRSKQKGKS